MTDTTSADELSWMKASQRATAAKVRERVHANALADASDKLLEVASSKVDWPDAAVISGFWPYQTEIDVMPLLEYLHADGHMICLPVVNRNSTPLEFRKWTPGGPTESGRWNIPVPAEGSEVVEPDILLVPLLAFDRRGYRLGYGGGFYDRTLAKLRATRKILAIGIAYQGQEVGAVVRGINDQKLDAILTEQEYIVADRS